MATYTVNITGSLNSSYAYATLAGTNATTTGTKTYTSKPSIAVYVSSSRSSLRSSCKVTLNGATVKSGYGSYAADIGDADIVNIQFNAVKSGSYTYYTCDITTETSDPMAPKDGHNTNIGSVARQIEGGTVLIGGVSREVESGLSLIGGVSRGIEFGGGMCVITITGSGKEKKSHVEIDGVTYTSATTVEVPPGTVIACYCNMQVKLNGTAVGSGSYQYTVNGNVSIYLHYLSSNEYGAKLEITEE